MGFGFSGTHLELGIVELFVASFGSPLLQGLRACGCEAPQPTCPTHSPPPPPPLPLPIEEKPHQAFMNMMPHAFVLAFPSAPEPVKCLSEL